MAVTNADGRRETKAIPLRFSRRRPSCRERPAVGGDVFWPACAYYALGAGPEATVTLRPACSLKPSATKAENGCLAVMLWTWPDLSHGLVEVSNLATRVKMMAGVLTEASMGALAVIWLMRWGVWRGA